MPHFKIEFSDTHFRLIVDEEYLEAVPYCSVSSVCIEGGAVYGAYLSGSEPDLDALDNHPTDVEMVTRAVKVYEISKWPVLSAVDAPVTLICTEFEGLDEGEDEEDDDEDGNTIEVLPQ